MDYRGGARRVDARASPWAASRPAVEAERGLGGSVLRPRGGQLSIARWSSD